MRKAKSIYWLSILLLTSCVSAGIPNTATPTMMATQTFVASSPVAPTQIITLDDYYLSGIVQEKYRALIQSNGGCKLPCLFGFIPGEATWSETKTIMGNYHKIVGETSFYENGSWPIYGVPLDFIDSNYGAVLSHFSATVETDIVQRMALYVETDSGSSLHQFWSYYSLRNIFAELGVPNRVVTFVYMHDLVAHPGYQFLVLYEEKGVAVWFSGDSKTGTAICPIIEEGGEVNHLQLSIANPASQLNILPQDWQFWFPMDDENDNEDYFDAEAAFGISVKEFYQKVLFDQEDCFDVIVSPE